MQAYLRLTKGPARGDLIELRMWQGDAICDILRLDEFGRRLYWTYLLLLPRKNSKSLLGAGMALDGLLDEPGAEVYGCAGDREQAKLVFREVKQSVEMSPELDAKQGGIFKVYRDAIEYPAMGSVYKALSAEAFTKEGLNPSRVIFDELHAQPNWELWNVMNQGSDTRDNPLILAISTFGVMTDTTGQTSVCKAQYDYVKTIMSGEHADPRYGARIYETNQERRGFSYRESPGWADANPALGDFLQPDKMQAACAKMPEADFKTKRLNIWVTSANPWLPDGAWDHAEDLDRVIPDHADVVLGFDGSKTGDSTALVVVSIEDRPHIDCVGLWERPPNTRVWKVPRAEVKDAIRDACKRWNVLEIAWDEYMWLDAAEDLEEEGLPVQFFPQTPSSTVPATQRLYEDLVDAGSPRERGETGVTHSGHPGLRRHVGNCKTKTDARGTRVMKDPNNPNKIDGAVAVIQARHRAAWHRGEGTPNVH